VNVIIRKVYLVAIEAKYLCFISDIQQQDALTNYQEFLRPHIVQMDFGVHPTPIKKKLHGLSLRANYIDRATAACRRSDCQLLRIRGCHVVSLTDPYCRILGFLDRSC
jgi:hypothetical protein